MLHLEVSSVLREQAPGTHCLVPANAGSIPNTIPPAPSLSAAYPGYGVRQECGCMGQGNKTNERTHAPLVIRKLNARDWKQHTMEHVHNANTASAESSFVTDHSTSDCREIPQACVFFSNANPPHDGL